MNSTMELAVTASMLLAAMCQTVTMYCKMLLPSNGGQDEAVHCMGQVCVTCVERAEIATVERRKEIALATAAFFFIMVSFITCVADLLVRRVTKSSHTLFVRITWCVTAASLAMALVAFLVTQSHLPQCFTAAIFTVVNGILALITGFLFSLSWQHKHSTSVSSKSYDNGEII